MTRNGTKQIRLLFVQFLNQLFQNVPLIECNTNARFGGVFHLCPGWVEKTSDVYVSVFITDRNVGAPANMMMVVDTLTFFVLFDTGIDVREEFVECNPPSKRKRGSFFRRIRFLPILRFFVTSNMNILCFIILRGR